MKKPTLTIILTLSLLTEISAQIGIGYGTIDPDTSAILELRAHDKGLLITRLGQADRDNLVPIAADGLLVYDTLQHEFLYFHEEVQNFISLSPWKTNPSRDTTYLNSPNNIKVPGFPDNALVPEGVIVMWSGSIETIPDGWVLCNGENGTPDLVDRFIVGAAKSYGVGDIGGADSVTLKAEESGIQEHDHPLNDPGHSHEHWDSYVPDEGHGYDKGGERRITHNRDRRLSTSSSKTWISIENNSSQDARQPHENRPPYYALAYIMKTE